MSLYYPLYIQILERTVDGWYQSDSKIVFNPNQRNVDVLNREKRHGLTKTEILTELFRRYQGKLGYYLVHLPKREYYYCGLSDRSVREKLWELGITKPDPMEEKS
jgi:hypothetical protein